MTQGGSGGGGINIKIKMFWSRIMLYSICLKPSKVDELLVHTRITESFGEERRNGVDSHGHQPLRSQEIRWSNGWVRRRREWKKGIEGKEVAPLMSNLIVQCARACTPDCRHAMCMRRRQFLCAWMECMFIRERECGGGEGCWW